MPKTVENLEALTRYLRERDDLSPWADAPLFSFSTVTLTPDQVRPLFEEDVVFLYRYKRVDAALTQTTPGEMSGPSVLGRDHDPGRPGGGPSPEPQCR